MGKPTDGFEIQMQMKGRKRIAGIDEVGRGCVAGPVVAAAVVYDPALKELSLNDSKKLTPKQRERLFPQIFRVCSAIGIGVSSAEQIDRINILQATRLAMKKAVLDLPVQPDVLLVDGRETVSLDIAQQAIVDGDSLSLAIAAASIVAKVYRDRWMERFATLFPGYGFEKHKGYLTPLHQEALLRWGATSLHRLSFRGVLPNI